MAWTASWLVEFIIGKGAMLLEVPGATGVAVGFEVVIVVAGQLLQG